MREKLAGLAAVASAVLASSCCILPAVLAALGAGSVGFGARLAAYRPYFMGVTFAFLGAAFYFMYRKRANGMPPRQSTTNDCCTVPAQEDCCAVPGKASRASKLTLWIVTVIALGAMFYAQIATWRQSGARQANAALLASDVSKAKRITFKIEGMSCAACAAGIEKSLLKVDGVTKAAVDFKSGRAVVEWNGKRPQQSALAKTVASVEGNRSVFNKETGQGGK